MPILKQAWWAPLAAVMAFTQVWVAAAFLYGEGTSNIVDAESTVAGVTIALSGAAAIIAGLWSRLQIRWLGNLLIIAGAVLGAFWVWIVFMVPLALVIIIGVIVSQVRSSPAPAAEAP